MPTATKAKTSINLFTFTDPLVSTDGASLYASPAEGYLLA
jgi:hypothetical protein